jgi:hypothetical protein
MIFASSPQAATISVTSTFDNLSTGSLRRAVADATAGDTIDFSGLALPATIALTSGEIVISKDLNIAGPAPRKLTISGGSSSRVFNISPAAGAINVAISGISISNGRDTLAGGCLSISANTTVTLTDATVKNCQVTDTGSSMGGAIHNSGTLTLNQVEVTNNSAVSQAGGIYSNTGTILTLNNCTISGNSANSAAAIFAYEILRINNSTITGNISALGTAAVISFISPELYNSILAGNSGGDLDGTPQTAHNNLIQTQTFGTLGADSVGNIVGVPAELGPLGNNGGPNDTHALLSGSPALNAGEALHCLGTDQRGIIRPQGAGCDIGSYELIQGQLGGALQGTPLNLTSANTGVSTIAGTAGSFGSTDGTGPNARFYLPFHLTTDGTALYVADRSNNTIRKVVIATGAVSTLAGTAGPGGYADGTGTAAQFSFPDGITTDGLNLYIADSGNNRIRKVVISTGAVTTLAGTGASGSGDGAALSATFTSPAGVTTDGLSLFVTESLNHTVRRISLVSGMVTTLAGQAGTSGSADGTGILARFNAPQGLTTDGVNLYIADMNNNSIRKIVIATGAVTTLAGTAGQSGSLDDIGIAARFKQPTDVTTDGTWLYTVDTLDHTIRKIDLISSPMVTTIAGNPGISGSSNGTGAAARFLEPIGITSNGVSLYVTDKGNHTIRQMPDTTPPSDGTLTATPGNAQVNLSWSGFSDAGDIATYKLAWDINGGTTITDCSTGIDIGNVTSYNNTPLANGTTYYYRVCAVDTAGNVSAGATASATPVPPPTLTITRTGPGNGSVSANSGILTWNGLIGTAVYPTGTAVTITAIPDFGTVFTGWLGACSGTAPCTVTMNSSLDVTATFAPATGFTVPVIPPFQTGQTTCYDPVSNASMPCTGTRQDGELRMGTPWPIPRFSANADMTVTDTLTGLIWAKDGSTPNLDVSPACVGGAMSWPGALAYVACLNTNSYLGYTDWRLPNINEMASLMSKGEANLPAWLNSQGFSGVPTINSFYWSSSTSALYNDSAWYANLLAASEAFSPKTSVNYVWPLRGGLAGSSRIPRTGQTTCYDTTTNAVISCTGTGQDGELQTGAAWPAPRFSANADQTITDTLTALAWPTDAGMPAVGACTGGTLSWQGALAYVDCLNSNSYLGHNDWRLPNSSELASLLHRGVADGAAWLTGQGFSNVISDYYWSSTTNSTTPSFAFAAYIIVGSLELDDKTIPRVVWPVRGGQSGSYATITASPAALTFADQDVGSSSAQSFVSIGNTGGGDALVSGISITGSDAGQFTVVASAGPSPCPSLTPVITPGSSCTVGISFTPASSGAKSAALSIAVNSPAAPVVTAPLSGTGLSLVQTPISVTGLPTTAVYGQAGIIASYSGGSGTGAVSYSAGASTACTVDPVSGAVTITSGTGTCFITVTKAADSTYLSATATASITTISPATPTVTAWPIASAITYGQLLTSSILTGGSASVPGAFAFTVPSTFPVAGTATQDVTFTPTDTTNYTTVTGTVNVTVNQAIPTVIWAVPVAITYGTALSATELNATASDPGSFAYTPASGSVLNAGTQLLSVTFTPTDTVNYTTQTGTTSLTVNQATPIVTWSAPAAITYGTALSATELNATASVPGTFAYTPTAGTVLTAGLQTLSVTFTPSDTLNYTTQTGTVNLTVNPAIPTVTWATPAAITFGTALSATQLNATASVPGTFAYTPTAGTFLTAGLQTLSVTFTPADTLNYTAQTGTVSLTVNPATPTVTWAAPAAITFGTALTATQLNATASVPGTFAYTPTAGTVLTAGLQTLSVTFTPTDTLNYTTQTGAASLTVNPATPTVTWATPAAITFGTALSATELNATASVPGTFTYTPTTGTVPTAGTQTLSVTFTPTDTLNYTTQTGTVSLTVNPAPTIITTTLPNVMIGSAYSQNITATGGTAPVTFTYSGTLPTGISLSSAGLLSGTAITPGIFPFTVTVADANLQSSSMPYTIVVIPPPDSATITGNITYTGAKTGRIYISVQTNRGTLGTSIAAPGAYSIRGVPNGSYTVKAFMDSLNLGTQVQLSPEGSTTTTLAGAAVSGVNITMTDPSPIAPPMPAAVSTSAGNGSVLIDWDKPRNIGVEAADSYDIYWSPLNTVSKTSFIGSRLNVPAGQDSPAVIDGLTNGTALYFVVVPKSGGIEGASSAAVGPITVGIPVGGYTVSGTVNYSGPTPTGPLHVAIVNPATKGAAGVYYTTITNPGATNSFSVAGVQNGSYVIYSIIDMNNDKLFGIGDVMTHDNQAPMITVNGAALSGIVANLAATNSELFINTDHVMMATGPVEWFSIDGGIRGQLKRPVAVTLTGAPAAANLAVPMDLGIDNENSTEFSFWTNNNVRPTVSDVYAFTITYADGTVDSTATATVTGVIDSFPTNVQILTPTSTVPTFSWGAPLTPPTTYKYGIWVSDNNGANFWDAWDLPSSMNSAVYGSTGDNAQPLQMGITYNWAISVSDQNNNRASIVSSFVPAAAGTPVITWQTPAPILSGTPLSAVQLNATASVPGTFSYSPPAGTVLSEGAQTLNVSFTPADTTNFTTATASTVLTVNPATLTVTATAGTGGSITPTGVISVPSGSAQGFTITPATGYSIADIMVDGVSQGAISSYSFTNVTASHTIDATFAVNTYVLTTSVSAGSGTIAVSPAATAYNHGTSVQLTANPASQWIFAGWSGDCAGTANPYSLVMNAAKSCSASFIPLQPITATATAGGSITPNGTTMVTPGSSQAYTITANSGYHIADVKVDGVSRGAIASYTFVNVTAPHTIDAVFAATPLTIAASGNSGGSITPVGTTTLSSGASQTYAIAANSGYVIADVRVDGLSVGRVSSYTFINITAGHTIEAVFAADGIVDPAKTRFENVVIALTYAMGDATPTSAQLLHIDTAPMINGVPQPDGKIDFSDVLLLLRRVVGLIPW